jgi:hypothetical protein
VTCIRTSVKRKINIPNYFEKFRLIPKITLFYCVTCVDKRYVHGCLLSEWYSISDPECVCGSVSIISMSGSSACVLVRRPCSPSQYLSIMYPFTRPDSLRCYLARRDIAISEKMFFKPFPPLNNINKKIAEH